MRTAIAASLIIATSLASVAQAQAPAAPMPMAPAPAPATAPMAAPAAPMAPAPGATAPMAAPAAAATPDAAAPAPAPDAPPPSLPTTGDGAQLISIIEKLCVPLVRGGKFDDLAKAMGMKQNRRDMTWSMQLGTTDKAYNVTVFSPGSNKDVCRGEVHYAIGQEAPIVSAFNVWSFLHQPELTLQANYVQVNADGVKRVQKSWEHFDASASTAINFTTETKPDDTPLNAKFATAEFYYQERKL